MIAEQLKKSILQAAIQGKLTQQLPDDGDTKDLLKEIQTVKEKLIKEGKIRKEKPLPKITEDEIPFEIPENWCWVRLGEIVNIIMGQSPPGNSVSVSQNGIEFHQGKVFFGKNYIKESNLSTNKPTKIADPDSVLLCVRAPVGIVNITQRKICIGRGLCAFNTLAKMKESVLLYILRSFENDFIKKATGTTFSAITVEVIKNQIIPLPPLAEQKRIVERIEDLLAEVEILKNDEIKLQNLQKTFPKKIKDSILQYAIQGKLTKQLPEDGDAKDLLKEIQTEKEKLIKEGKINKEKPLPKITEDEIPFEIPENWCWVRFGNLVNFRIGKTPQRNNGRFWGQDYHWVSIADMKPDGLISETKEKISGIALNEVFKKTLVPAGTLLMSFKLTIGRVSILDINAVHNEAIISILPYKNEENIARNYYFKILPLISTTGNFKSAIKGKTLNSTSINNLLIPLPPLAEQKRIVARIEELLPLCEELSSLES